ncbi:hypothetical protein EV715DRAFT_270699 [Schizophyllum commune]
MKIPQDTAYATQLCSKCSDTFSSHLQTTRNNLRLCDREMQRLRTALAELYEHRALIHSMSPVWRLPTEILAEIASYTLPPRCHWTIRMLWPWVHINLHDYRPSDGLAAWIDASVVCLQRCGSYPLKVIQNALWPLAERICELELQCPDGNSPFPRRLMALRRLWLTGPFGGTVYAPKLCILELFGCSMSRLNVTWANLRVLRAGLDVRQEDLNVLRECVRLEELSFSAWDQGEYFGPQPISLPALHTLEIGHGALGLCSQLDVLSLRHFCLNFACNRLCKRPYEVCEWLQGRNLTPVVNLIRPLTSLTQTLPHTTGPQNWLEVIFIIDRPTTQRRESSFLHSFVLDVRRLLEAWCTPAVLHGRYASLQRLRIYTPHAEFPALELEESWANMRRTDGERILEVSTRE